jgi:DNA repair photolyase
MEQPTLFDTDRPAYRSRAVPLFEPQRIILARGSTVTDPRRRLVQAVCRVYPDAKVIERPDVPHNRIDLSECDALRLHYQGKRTLVIGEHRSAVRRSEEQDNTCPNYWHFSPYGFCPYDCQYCYLAGTRGVRFSPAVKIHVNLPEMLAEIDRVATRLGEPTAFYLGKLQDGLALDPLTGYSRVMTSFFAEHRHARLVVLTQSADVENLLDLDHRGRTILSWSVNAPEVCEAFEANTPSMDARLHAMQACAAAGYPVRAVLMPIVPVPDWPTIYDRLLERLLTAVPLDRLTLGGICIYPSAKDLMDRKLGAANLVS